MSPDVQKRNPGLGQIASKKGTVKGKAQKAKLRPHGEAVERLTLKSRTERRLGRFTHVVEQYADAKGKTRVVVDYCRLTDLIKARPIP